MWPERDLNLISCISLRGLWGFDYVEEFSLQLSSRVNSRLFLIKAYLPKYLLCFSQRSLTNLLSLSCNLWNLSLWKVWWESQSGIIFPPSALLKEVLSNPFWLLPVFEDAFFSSVSQALWRPPGGSWWSFLWIRLCRKCWLCHVTWPAVLTYLSSSPCCQCHPSSTDQRYVTRLSTRTYWPANVLYMRVLFLKC